MVKHVRVNMTLTDYHIYVGLNENQVSSYVIMCWKKEDLVKQHIRDTAVYQVTKQIFKTFVVTGLELQQSSSWKIIP